MREFESNKEKIKLNSERIRERERKIKVLKRAILLMILFLIIMYFLLRIVFETGYFTISLDPTFAMETGLVMYENIDEKIQKKILKATKVENMDNISVKWLPDNLHQLGGGNHNGENYLVYTFYLENQGSDPVNYWYQITVDDVIKNVDKAIRIMLYRNGEKTIYAKPNERTGLAEIGTEMFYSNMEPVLECRENFAAGEIDKFTIVVFLEGDDPDCVDALIGGEMKMHMDIIEEHIAKD